VSAFPTRTLRALGTSAVVATAKPDTLAEARAVLVRGLRAFDLACSRFRDDSELSALNRSAGGAVPVGEILWNAVAVAIDAARATDGLVDPTVGRSLRLAGYDRSFSRIRLRDGRPLAPAFEPAGRWRELELDEERRTIRVPTGVELDLGATAKALAADNVAWLAAARTRGGVLVSLGGDVAVAGQVPDGGWTIRIADDHASATTGLDPVVAIDTGGLATSGVSVRRWHTVSGEVHHILDPRTGRPAEAVWRTVSVVANSCVGANAASTAAIVLGEAAPAWLLRRRLPARLVRVDGLVVRVAGWPPDHADAA